MLPQSKLPQYLQAEAFATANYIQNKFSSSTLNNEIPYKLWNGKDPNVKYFRTFGTLAYVLDKTPGKKKFEAKSKPYYLLGYCTNAKAYRLWNKETGKVIKSRDVKFVNEYDITVHRENNNDNNGKLVIYDPIVVEEKIENGGRKKEDKNQKINEEYIEIENKK